VIADLTTGEAGIAEGPPCATEYERYPLHTIFGAWDIGPRERGKAMG